MTVMPSVPPTMESAEYSVDDCFDGDRLYRNWAGYFNPRGETIMVRGKRLLLGWAALVLLGGPALADDSYFAKADGPAVRSASAAATANNRKVQVWRGDAPSMAPAPLYTDSPRSFIAASTGFSARGPSRRTSAATSRARARGRNSPGLASLAQCVACSSAACDSARNSC